MTSMNKALEALKQVIRAQVIDDLLETLVDAEWSAAEHNADDVPALIKAIQQLPKVTLLQLTLLSHRRQQPAAPPP
jgi:hypothetical protein